MNKYHIMGNDHEADNIECVDDGEAIYYEDVDNDYIDHDYDYH